MLSILSTENYKQTSKIMPKPEEVNIPKVDLYLPLPIKKISGYPEDIQKWGRKYTKMFLLSKLNSGDHLKKSFEGVKSRRMNLNFKR